MADELKTIRVASETSVPAGEDIDVGKVDNVEQHGEDGHYLRSFTARQIHVILVDSPRPGDADPETRSCP